MLHESTNGFTGTQDLFLELKHGKHVGRDENTVETLKTNRDPQIGSKNEASCSKNADWPPWPTFAFAYHNRNQLDHGRLNMHSINTSN